MIEALALMPQPARHQSHGLSVGLLALGLITLGTVGLSLPQRPTWLSASTIALGGLTTPLALHLCRPLALPAETQPPAMHEQQLLRRQQIFTAIGLFDDQLQVQAISKVIGDSYTAAYPDPRVRRFALLSDMISIDALGQYPDVWLKGGLWGLWCTLAFQDEMPCDPADFQQIEHHPRWVHCPVIVRNAVLRTLITDTLQSWVELPLERTAEIARLVAHWLGQVPEGLDYNPIAHIVDAAWLLDGGSNFQNTMQRIQTLVEATPAGHRRLNLCHQFINRVDGRERLLAALRQSNLLTLLEQSGIAPDILERLRHA